MAVPFIQVDPSSKRLVVTEEARAYLSQVSGTVGVVAVAGVYRTGKSYILNQLAGTTGSGFGVGNSVQAKTKGIWLWGAPLRLAPTPGAPQNLLLLDTEGLQSIAQTEGHDAKIFCLAILLASAFVYNSEKAINNAAIDQLSLVAQLTQRIRVHAEGEAAAARAGGADALAQFFPRFTWLLRDFQLELLDGDGAALTPDAYLESCLQPAKGTSAAIQEQNATRAAIRTLFTERSCIALPHPTLGTALPPSALKALDKTPLSALNADFVSGVQQLKRRLFEGARPKSLGAGGPALTGRTLLQLAGSYCEAINAGALPTISTAWSAVINLECQRALDEAARLYVDGASAATRSAGALPDEVRWNAEHVRLQEASVRHFRSLAMGSGPEADAKEAKLLELIGAEKGKVDALLGARSEALCEKLVASLLDRFGRCAREATAAAVAAAAASVAAPPAAPAAAAAASPAHALPAALAQLLAEYDRSAQGPSKEAGRAALLTRAAPLMADALAAAEREQARAAAAAQQAAVAARADAATAMSRAAKAEAAAATHERDLRAALEQLESERARARERGCE